MKNRQVVSDVIGELRALTVDDRISKRFVLSKLRTIASTFIKRENDTMRLYNYDTLWTTVNCLQMEHSDNISCSSIVIPRCKIWMKSKCEIPAIYSSKYGLLIREVTSLRGVPYNKTTPKDYEKILKREYRDLSKKYYWLENNRLVIPDSEVELVTMTSMPEDPAKMKLIDNCSESKGCSNPLDEDFNCPPHLVDVVRSKTIDDLFRYYKRVVVDELPNLDSNQKTNNAG